LLGLSIGLFGTLPDALPIHFNLSGDPDSYQATLIAALLLPVIYIVILLVARWLVNISPAQYAMPNSQTAISTILFGAGLVLAFIPTAIVLFIEGTGIRTQIISSAIALFFIVVGNAWGKTERNFFLGLRFPWTITSEMNWKASHRLTGKRMVVACIGLIIISMLSQSLVPAIVFSLLTVLIPVLYSYWYFKNYESKNPN